MIEFLFIFFVIPGSLLAWFIYELYRFIKGKKKGVEGEKRSLFWVIASGTVMTVVICGMVALIWSFSIAMQHM